MDRWGDGRTHGRRDGGMDEMISAPQLLGWPWGSPALQGVEQLRLEAFAYGSP